eukprot:1314912-Amorphochlora_amoeboformis.AAC.1
MPQTNHFCHACRLLKFHHSRQCRLSLSSWRLNGDLLRVSFPVMPAVPNTSLRIELLAGNHWEASPGGRVSVDVFIHVRMTHEDPKEIEGEGDQKRISGGGRRKSNLLPKNTTFECISRTTLIFMPKDTLILLSLATLGLTSERQVLLLDLRIHV